MRNDREYQIYVAISKYLRYAFPYVLYHWDYAGLNLSKVAAGKMKAIQHSKGYPDLVILESRGQYKSLFLEIKSEGTKLYNKQGQPATTHIAEQMDCLLELRMRGYKAEMIIGFDEAKTIIDEYLNKTTF